MEENIEYTRSLSQISVHSGIDALGMSYERTVVQENDDDSASLTQEEILRASTISKTKYISPMERRRQAAALKVSTVGEGNPSAVAEIKGQQQAEDVIEAGVEAVFIAESQDPREPFVEPSDSQASKRVLIQKVMKDTTLSPVERNLAIQNIMTGIAIKANDDGDDDDDDDDDDSEVSDDDSESEDVDNYDDDPKLSDEDSDAEDNDNYNDDKKLSDEDADDGDDANDDDDDDNDDKIADKDAEDDDDDDDDDDDNENLPDKDTDDDDDKSSSSYQSSYQSSSNAESISTIATAATATAEAQLRVASAVVALKEEQQRLAMSKVLEEATVKSERLLLEERLLKEARDRDLQNAQRQQEEEQLRQHTLHMEAAERRNQQLQQQRIPIPSLPTIQEESRAIVESPSRNPMNRRSSTEERYLTASQQLALRQGQGLRSAVASSLTARILPSNSARADSQSKSIRYDGVDDDELNWRLDSRISLSDFTIIVNRALPGPSAPDFETLNLSDIDFVTGGSNGRPKQDVYHIHKAMIAVGSRRSELLGRRIREAENSSRDSSPETTEINVHNTIMLESAADVLPQVLDFCYHPESSLDLNVENAVPLLYLGKRYKIRALLEQAETYVMENIIPSTAMYFLLDSYLFRLEDILGRSIDVTAANLADTVDFETIYRLPPALFRRIILSKELICESDLLSLIVYSYCGEHHAEDVDVEYFRDVTKLRIMPEIDPNVALLVLKYYIDLMIADDDTCNIMEMLPSDSLMQRCITVIAKNWKEEVCEPMIMDSGQDNAMSRQPSVLHRTLPLPLQNYIFEKCILQAKNDSDLAEGEMRSFEKTKILDRVELENSMQVNERHLNEQIFHLHNMVADLADRLTEKAFALEEYKQELKNFRRVPGIHTFGVCKGDIIDKTTCTYSANPDHHSPNHRRGNRRPTQMPVMVAEMDNLGKENGYIYDDGKGELLPVFYYESR